VSTDLGAAVTNRLLQARGVVFDMDGTLALGDASSDAYVALPGAIELPIRLRARDLPFRVFTNGTARTPAVYGQGLRRAGLDVRDEQMLTPSCAAAFWFLRHGVRRIRVLGREGVEAPLLQAGLQVIASADRADAIQAVYTGWFREFTFPDLEAACRDIWAGALFTTASNVPFFASRGGRVIGPSYATNTMIRGLTGKRVTVLGKPSRAAMQCAVRSMGLPLSALRHTVVVGDDPALEIRMARREGALAIAVTTGLKDRKALTAASHAERPM
jgi:4-nitrophenyl phosphatase